MAISIKQKKTYIERITNNDILTRELKINILKIVISSNKLSAIRESKSSVTGIFIDLNKISNDDIDSIYNVIKQYDNFITMK